MSDDFKDFIVSSLLLICVIVIFLLDIWVFKQD
jgi:hypothetical protein